MTESDNAVFSLAELIRDTGNLLAFHKRCGLVYPRSPDITTFLKTPLPRISHPSLPGPEQTGTAKTETAAAPTETKTTVCSLDNLSAMIAECRSCSPGEGTDRISMEPGNNTPVGLMIVCDPPQVDTPEVAPIQGEARDLLSRMLTAIDLTMDEVHLTSIIKCRLPKGERSLEKRESYCLDWLEREADLVSPRIILTLGPLSARLILQTGRQLFTVRGRLHDWRKIPLVSSYHPEILLKHQELKKASWEDLKLVKKILNR